MSKLSSKIDLLKTTVSKRHSNYCGLKKNSFFTVPQKVAPSYIFFAPFGATWPILGAILDPAGFQGGFKNHVFGYHVGKMRKKGCPKTRPEKTSKFN